VLKDVLKWLDVQNDLKKPPLAKRSCSSPEEIWKITIQFATKTQL
jgi:hypothetical protein